MENLRENPKPINAYDFEKYLEKENTEVEPDMVRNIKNVMEEK